MDGPAKFIIPLATGLTLWACAANPGTRAAVVPDAQLVQQRCAGCHAVGDDDASLNPAAPPLRSLHRRYPIDALREAFLKGMEVGHRDMPTFVLRPEEIDRLLLLIRSFDPCARPSTDEASMAKCFAPVGR